MVVVVAVGWGVFSNRGECIHVGSKKQFRKVRCKLKELIRATHFNSFLRKHNVSQTIGLYEIHIVENISCEGLGMETDINTEHLA